MRLRRLCWVALTLASAPVRAEFTFDERDCVRSYWADASRYSVAAPPNANKVGVWQVRLTPEGSTWLWNYNHARGLGKVPPSAVPDPQNDRQKVWESWIEGRIAYDRWQAAINAADANEKALGVRLGEVPPKPADPGLIPGDLAALVGDAPPFAAAVSPQQHTVRFDDGTSVTYVDQVAMKPRYAYFRFPQGVMYGGTPVRRLTDDEVGSLFAESGIDGSAAKVMRSVSLLEGGFDSVNTYDTGFVSVGFIQFACLSSGAGSLGQVLVDMKRVTPGEFDRAFRRFGIDVEDNGTLDIVDPATGNELRGLDGAKKVIDDKRLIAVFQRAGAVCRAFRLAQLRVAKTQFYPADDAITVVGAEGPMAGKVSDFVKSEAGMATLMDRKVNTGKTDPLASIAGQVARERGVRTLPELAAYERDIIAALRYRKDYLADTTLSQPPATTAVPRVFNAFSRSGMRHPHRANRRG